LAIFNDLEQPRTNEKLSIDKLKANLSESQLKVARQNYRVIITEMALYMDVNTPNIKETVSRGVIERLLMYQI